MRLSEAASETVAVTVALKTQPRSIDRTLIICPHDLTYQREALVSQRNLYCRRGREGPQTTALQVESIRIFDDDAILDRSLKANFCLDYSHAK